MPRGIFLPILFLVLAPISLVLAQETVNEKINARILPTVWFSTLKAKEGEKVKIYAAVQNNSGLNFKGEIIFYADGVELAKTPFSSTSETLAEVSAIWLATGGDHSFRVKILDILPEGKELLSYESAEAAFSVPKEITLAEVQESAVKNVVKIATIVSEKIDRLAVSLADKLESTKNTPKLSVASDAEDAEEEVLVRNVSTSSKNSLSASTYNAGVDVFNLLLRNWMWTLSGLAVLALFWSFKS